MRGGDPTTPRSSIPPTHHPTPLPTYLWTSLQRFISLVVAFNAAVDCYGLPPCEHSGCALR